MHNKWDLQEFQQSDHMWVASLNSFLVCCHIFFIHITITSVCFQKWFFFFFFWPYKIYFLDHVFKSQKIFYFFCLFVLFLAFGFWLSWVEIKVAAWEFREVYKVCVKTNLHMSNFQENHTSFYVFNLLKNLYETAVGFFLFWNAFVIAVHKKKKFVDDVSGTRTDLVFGYRQRDL